jgi:exonuclease III
VHNSTVANPTDTSSNGIYGHSGRVINCAVEGFMVSDVSHWSKAADDANKEAFHVSELGLIGEVLHCKHQAGGFGTVQVASVLQGRIQLFEKTADRMTIFRNVEELIGKYRNRAMPYHIDYIFVPTTWLENMVSFEIGKFEDWCAPGFSDHAPLIAEFG